MTPERLAELRRLREEYRQAQTVMLDASPLSGETNDEWQAACGVNAAARSAWVTALHESEDDLLATAEREAKLRAALRSCLSCMEIQEHREDESFHLSVEAFRPMWDEAKANAVAALESKGGES